MNRLQSPPFLQLDRCTRETLLAYFDSAWELEESLMKSAIAPETFALSPDPLRNPLIFYLGHSAVFYINKLIGVELLSQRLNPAYETLFAVGVDPETPGELNEATEAGVWPEVEAVWQYRDRVREAVTTLIRKTPLNLPIHPRHPLWALMMGIEHSRIHFETSAMLLRQLPESRLQRPPGWEFAPSSPNYPRNEMRVVSGGTVQLGKPQNAIAYGWDSDYGDRAVTVQSFLASRYLVTNGEFLEFVRDGGYNNPDCWDREAWQWLQQHRVQHPKFWQPTRDGYRYRGTFDEIDLPLDWPVEANHYEATAFCRWKGGGTRLMSEAEWNRALAEGEEAAPTTYNLDFRFSSPTPVGMLGDRGDTSPLCDVRGNVWEWLGDPFAPLPGFQPHPLYEDYSAPFFDGEHYLMVGGAWSSTGAYASPDCRNWFRPYFYQHVGFRMARDLE